jgi:ketosteroid isomerase-like protein
MAVASAELVAQEFVDALTAQDWQRVEACFAPDARLLAAVPNDANPLRDRTGPADVTSQLAAWFGDGDPLELEASTIEQIAGKVHVAYRLRSFEDGAWYVVEQQGYCQIGDRGIERLHLSCSGFHPLDTL